MVVDEEQRFGVRHKERLKSLRAEVDMLTLTATPIPRTLNMTLGGLRDLSLIATPPAERLSVKTFVGEWSNQSIREAVLRELRRGGQTYFVHNRVQDIDGVAANLEKLLPEAEIRVAHGQMAERTLERVMLDFYHRKFNLLVCSTIIESGIDIPTANTIIINRADRLGLAQLHQLRGRVGRSHHQAYAYLIAPPARVLTADAAKRSLKEPVGLTDSRPSKRWRNWVPGLRWPRMIWRSAARESCSARNRAVRFKPSGSRCITICWRGPSPRCETAGSRSWSIHSSTDPR